MIVDAEIAFNMIQDFRKKDISPVKRAELIESYREHMGLSQRALAKELDMSHSTLQDWIRYGQLTESEYDTLLKRGIGKEEIYHTIRNKRKNTPYRLKGLLEKNITDIVLENIIRKIEEILPIKEVTPETRKNMNKLKSLINRMEQEIG